MGEKRELYNYKEEMVDAGTGRGAHEISPVTLPTTIILLPCLHFLVGGGGPWWFGRGGKGRNVLWPCG